MMKNKYLLIIAIVFMVFTTGCERSNNDISTINNRLIAVSIIPEKAFVEKVAGDLVEVVVLVPPGNSPANYEPTPKDIEKFSRALIYFTIGVPTEKSNILPKVRSLNNKLKIVSLSKEVSKTYNEIYFDSEHKHIDPHIWLSPKRVKIMVKEIANELSNIDPEHEIIYKANAEKYIKQLDDLDKYIKDKLNQRQKNSFIVYHPAFGYYANDYKLEQISIQKPGRSITLKSIDNIIDFAKKENIKYIFYQKEFSGTKAEVLAKEINGQIEVLSPLAFNYIYNMRSMTDKIVKALK